MNFDDALKVVQELVSDIASEVDTALVDAGLSEDFGLDSIDSLNLAVAVKDRTGVEIPDRDMPALVSMRRLAEYLVSHG